MLEYKGFGLTMKSKGWCVFLFGVWCALNVAIFIKSSKVAQADKIHFIYPFNYKNTDTCLWGYDLSELIFYIFIFPFFILGVFQIISLKVEKENRKMRKYLLLLLKLFVLYCFGFAAISFFDSSVIVEFYLAFFKGGIIVLLSFYVSYRLLGLFSEK